MTKEEVAIQYYLVERMVYSDIILELLNRSCSTCNKDVKIHQTESRVDFKGSGSKDVAISNYNHDIEEAGLTWQLVGSLRVR